MKRNKTLLLTFLLMVVAASVYRVWPDRPFGFAPQWAIAVFAGAVISDRKWAFALPLASMILSDVLYQLLYQNGFTDIWGFYSGMWSNYLMLTALTVFGFLIANRKTVVNIAAASLAAPSAYFLLSNFTVWLSGGGYQRPKTAEGLMMCYTDGIPFYAMSLLATPIFCALLFGLYFLVTRNEEVRAGQIA